jgi:hypothetical protein
MRIFWAAAAAILVCGAARAEGPMPSPVNGDAAVGVICNTSEEARQFVDLRSHGVAPDQCKPSTPTPWTSVSPAAIAYVHDGTVDTMKLENQLVQIVRINVVAGFNGSAWQRVSGTVQYAVREGGGESI